ncbi:MAG: hypothetical protein ABIJ61_00585 [bacterium]
MGKSILLWFLALVITLASVIYQRSTGPTYPVKGEVSLDGQTVEYALLTSHETTTDAVMRIPAPATVSGELRWRRFKSHDEWQAVPLPREGNELLVTIPRQPSAGKVMYEVTLSDAGGNDYQLSAEPVIVRFKDPVPAPILFPHIFFMFFAMFLSTRTGLEAITGGPKAYGMSMVTAVCLLIGGLILGPLVQKYAFGAFWTGWPFGHDLTDNKTLFAFIFWVIAIWRNKPPRTGRIWIIIAAVVTLGIYLIPHSVLGSEIDYTQQQP